MYHGKEQEMRKQKSFLRKVQFLQSAGIICVFLMMLSLVRISALVPGVSKEADEQKVKAKQTVYEKEYVRGKILDRNGEPLAWSEKAGGERYYASNMLPRISSDTGLKSMAAPDWSPDSMMF